MDNSDDHKNRRRNGKEVKIVFLLKVKKGSRNGRKISPGENLNLLKFKESKIRIKMLLQVDYLALSALNRA